MEEKKLTEQQEIILYRISIRQDEQGREPTVMFKSKMLEDPMYTELLDLEYLTYEEYGEGDEAIVNLIVTLKGQRYCFNDIDRIAALDRNSRKQW